MPNRVVRIAAFEAARLMVDGTESEYLHAKKRAVLKLGSRLPSNRAIKECISLITRHELGDNAVDTRIREMRTIALEIMTALDDCDPFLIGSTLSGKIRRTSDIDLHAYSDDWESLKCRLLDIGYEEVEEELVENRKGTFVHLRWEERGYPVEITIYPWATRDQVLYSSVTGKPMKRADLKAVQALLRKMPTEEQQA